MRERSDVLIEYYEKLMRRLIEDAPFSLVHDYQIKKIYSGKKDHEFFSNQTFFSPHTNKRKRKTFFPPEISFADPEVHTVACLFKLHKEQLGTKKKEQFLLTSKFFKSISPTETMFYLKVGVTDGPKVKGCSFRSKTIRFFCSERFKGEENIKSHLSLLFKYLNFVNYIPQNFEGHFLKSDF